MQALLIIDHGSRRAEANACLHEVASMVRDLVGPDVLVQPAHMELAEPDIEQAFAACVEAGATHVVAVPYFLGPGRHATVDIPSLVARAAQGYRGVTWRVTEVLGPNPLLAQLVVRRAALD